LDLSLQQLWRFPHSSITALEQQFRARRLKWFAANDKAVQAETDQYCKQYGKLTRKRFVWVSCAAGV
jgi:hypothetical protein